MKVMVARQIYTSFSLFPLESLPPIPKLALGASLPGSTLQRNQSAGTGTGLGKG
jgi:hypothetical protein